jgi:hypothetical protein
MSAVPVMSEGFQGDPPRYEFSDDFSIELPGYYRFRFTHESGMTLYKIPTGARKGEFDTVGTIDYTEHRLRLNPKATLFKKLTINLQIDLFTGMLSGSTAGREYMWFAQREQRWNDHDGFDFDNFMDYQFKRFWGDWDSPVGLLRVGRQGSDWGLGMIVNNGNGFRNDWGDAYYGDNVDRVLFATKPYSIFSWLFSGEKPEKDPVTVAFAYDWNVARDSTLKLEPDKWVLPRASTGENKIVLHEIPEDDHAHQYVGAIQIDTTDYGNTAPFKAGFYAAKRYMEHQDVLLPANNKPPEEFLDVWVFDLYGSLTLNPRTLDGWQFFLEGEIAGITGETNFLVSKIVADPGNPFPVSTVSQLGWVLRGGLSYKKWFSLDLLNLGYASGDSNPFDDQVRNFKFHPDYNVGMILFEDLLTNISDASAVNATLGLGEAGPVRTLGTDLLPNNGSVTNAFYVNPVLRVYPMENLQTMLGILWARTATKYVDPIIDYYYGGGYGVFNPLGALSTNTDYGWEIDFGVQYTFDWTYLDLVLGIQYAHFFPGNVFRDLDGNRMDDIDKVQTRLTLLW